jgi:hypothetical protein
MGTIRNGSAGASGSTGSTGSTGFTGSGSAPFSFTRTISSDTSNYNLYNDLIANGWNGTSAVNVNVTIASGIVLYASTNTVAAFTVGNLPSGSPITITNSGYIVGRGGEGAGKGYPSQSDYNNTAPSSANGGTALTTTIPISINNLGTIGGGGGGGGVGGATAADCSCSGCGGVELNGMGPGGGGAGYGSAGQGYTNWRNNTGYRLSLVSANAGSATSAGSGYGTGGAGGGLGQAGSTGGGSSACGYTAQAGPGTGGAAGACTNGNSNITWINTGTRLGALN